MNLRDALIRQAPSLALQREAQAEIARLDAAVARLSKPNDPLTEEQIALGWELHGDSSSAYESWRMAVEWAERTHAERSDMANEVLTVGYKALFPCNRGQTL